MITDERARAILAEVHASLLIAASNPCQGSVAGTALEDRIKFYQGRIVGIMECLSEDEDEQKRINLECVREAVNILIPESVRRETLLRAAARGVDYREWEGDRHD